MCIYNEHNLNVARVASKNGIKPELSSVFFTKDRTVATDSYRLLEVEVSKDLDWEKFRQATTHPLMKGVKPFMVNAKLIKEIRLPKVAESGFNAVAIAYADDNKVEFITNDLQTENTIKMARVQGEFPDYQRVIPQGGAVAEIKVNAEYLAEVVEILGKMGGVSNEVKIKFYGQSKPLVIEGGNEKQRGLGLVMPLAM